MAYNVLNKAYTYVNADAETDTSFAGRIARMDLLQDIFSTAGWSITEVPYRVYITTQLPSPLVPSHTFCNLYNIPGPEDTLFAIEFSDTGATDVFVVDNVLHCWDMANYSPFGATVSISNYSASFATIFGNPPSESDWTAYISDGIYTNTEKTHERVWQAWIIKFLERGDATGAQIKYLGTEFPTSPNTLHRSVFTVDTDAIIEYRPAFGGFLGSLGSLFEGRGFIATSGANTTSANFSQIYVYTNPDNNRIYIRTVFGDSIDLVDLFENGTHPLDVVEDEDAKAAGDRYISPESYFLPANYLHGYVGPYFYMLDNGSTSRSIFGGCLTPKILEAGASSHEVTRIRYFRGFTAVAFSWGELIVNAVSTMNRSGATVAQNTFRTHQAVNGQASSTRLIQEWPGAVADVFEPWAGIDIFDNTNSPLYATIPATIVPGRNHAPGLTRAQDLAAIPFVFDEHLWRYWENTYGPIAFWISDPRAYTASGKTPSIPMYKLDSASLLPASFTAGSTNVLTLTIVLGDQVRTDLGGYVLVYTDNERITVAAPYLYYAYFNPGATTTTVNLTENSLEITEIVNIKVFHDAGNSIYNLPVTANA